MSIKIFGGLAKSHSLKTPPETITRPTSILLRRKMFDYKQNWDKEIFVDACAGSGAMGLEAWSRGAEKVLFIEANAKAFKVLQDNLRLIKNKFPQEVRERSLEAVHKPFQKYCQNQRPFEGSVTVFVDPPYEKHELYNEIIELLCTDFPVSVTIWVETDKHSGPDLEQLALVKYGFVNVKTAKQGNHRIGVFKREEN